MRVLFVGHSHLAPRVERLSQLLAEAGHEVRKVGMAPQVVHLHGWWLGMWADVIAIVFPQARLIWTIDSRPVRASWWRKAMVRRAARVFDVITVPRRDLQYELLLWAGVRAVYIPDGYDVPHVKTLSCRRFGVWPGRYCVASVGDETDEQFVRQAYEEAGSKRPLLFVRRETSSRVAAALLQSSAAILLWNERDGSERILQAMAAGKPLLALARPFYQEILGVTARYVQEGDREELTRVVREVLRGRALQPLGKARGKQAQRRAEKHFRWERILADYLPLYRPSGRLVPLDSATLYPRADVAEWQTRTA